MTTPTTPKTTPSKLTRDEQFNIMWPHVIKLLLDKDSGFSPRPGATLYRLLSTEITGSHGYSAFHAHLTIVKADFEATMRACTNPMAMTPAVLLAQILKRVNYHVTIAVWDEDFNVNNPRKYARHATPAKTLWHTQVPGTATTERAEAARALCAATGTVAAELAAAFAEATDFLQGKTKKVEGKTIK